MDHTKNTPPPPKDIHINVEPLLQFDTKLTSGSSILILYIKIAEIYVISLKIKTFRNLYYTIISQVKIPNLYNSRSENSHQFYIF